MNSRMRPWREAATLLLAAGTPGRLPRSPPGHTDYELLLLQRSSRSGFMAGAHVFPGGLLEAADFSAEWLGLLPASPQCGLSPVRPPPPGSSRTPLFAAARERLGSPLPGEVAFRICAIRETFEEAGILLLVPGPGPAAGSGPAPLLPEELLPPAAELSEWRRRVQEEPGSFLQLCRHLGCVPNIWALQEWSNWLTPVDRAGRGGRRYDTAFYLCCLEKRPPRTSQDDQEVTAFLVRGRGFTALLCLTHVRSCEHSPGTKHRGPAPASSQGNRPGCWHGNQQYPLNSPPRVWLSSFLDFASLKLVITSGSH
ncbi:nucleoside diphosphate-linked moiety X motif 19 isoform X2 [Calypte anna]|uniref:nucleoside diphosphate-linked moiety X motif 19 isoform X2 n=1 Tax=Calypte anna TaxID=9244 RepID=UPI0011C3B6FB|nr:nucleoside diphosphate-linked moiety X motif 19 isoform X2 [Calypte anna]